MTIPTLKDWLKTKDEMIPLETDFSHERGTIQFTDGHKIKNFILTSRRAINNEKTRQLIVDHLNYFSKYFNTNPIFHLYGKYKMKIEGLCAIEDLVEELYEDLKLYPADINDMNKINIECDKHNQKYFDSNRENIFKLFELSMKAKIAIPLLMHMAHINGLSAKEARILQYEFIQKLLSKSRLHLILKNDVSLTVRNKDVPKEKREETQNKCFEEVLLNIVKYDYTLNLFRFNSAVVRTTIKYLLIW